jgi:hypothetical protein
MASHLAPLFFSFGLTRCIHTSYAFLSPQHLLARKVAQSVGTSLAERHNLRSVQCVEPYKLTRGSNVLFVLDPGREDTSSTRSFCAR